MNKVFYTVEQLTQDVGDDIHELNGWKKVSIYLIHVDDMMLVGVFEGENCNDTETEIKKYIKDKGISYISDESIFTKL